MWATQYNIPYNTVKITGTILPPPFTLPENVKCHLMSKASPRALAVPLTLFHFFPLELFPSETLVYYLSLTIRLYTPDLGYPLPRRGPGTRQAPNKYK